MDKPEKLTTIGHTIRRIIKQKHTISTFFSCRGTVIKMAINFIHHIHLPTVNRLKIIYL
jgi:hypothetical protein